MGRSHPVGENQGRLGSVTALGAFVSADISRVVAVLFVAAMLALIACLLLFLREIFLAVSTPRHVPR